MKKNYVKKLIKKILVNSYSKFDAISEIQSKTNDNNFNLFFEEFKIEYQRTITDFTVTFTDIEITEALQFYEKELPIVKLDENAFLNCKLYMRKIYNYDCIQNCFGFENIKFPNKESIVIEPVNLNELLISYYSLHSFFDESLHKESFDGIEVLREIYNYILDFNKKLTSKETINKSNNKKQKPTKILNDFIFNVKDKDLFIADFVETFNTEKGIPIKILVELLKGENIILIPSRGFKPFYNCLKDKFNRDIGTYTALNDLYKHSKDDQDFYKKDIEIILTKLKPLLVNHKTS